MTKQFTPIDHENEAGRNVLNQYQRSPLFVGFVDSFTKEMNALEQQFQLFMADLPLAKALGINLTKWASILAAKQRPAQDEEMRALLYALIGAYNSEGTPENIRALVIATVTADAVEIEDIGGATYSFTIFNGTFRFGAQTLFQIVDLATPAGVELLPFKLAAVNQGATFSFLGDPRPKSEGYAVAVPRSAPSSYYAGYSFPAAGAITTAARITHQVTITPLDNTEILIYTAESDTWTNELLAGFAVVNGSIGFYTDLAGNDIWRLVCLDPSIAYTWETVSGYRVHHFWIIRNGLFASEPYFNDEIQSVYEVQASFPTIDATGKAAWDANNPSGMTKVFTQGATIDPLDYGIKGGGRYSLAITPFLGD